MIFFSAILAFTSAFAQVVAPEYAPGEVEADVVFHFPGEAFCFALADDGAAWRIEAANIKALTSVKEHMRIIARGEILQNGITPQMYNAEVEVVATDVDIPPPLEMTPKKLYAIGPGDTAWKRSWYGRIVTTRGVVRDINRRSTYAQLLIGPESYPVMVSLPIRRDVPLPDGLETGVEVRVTGVGVYRVMREMSGAWTPVHDIEVRLRGKEWLEIVTPLPFWTKGRILVAFGIFAIIMFSLLWVEQRGRVRERIATEAVHRERLRLSADLHDSFQQLLASCSFRLGAAMNYLKSGAPKEEVLDRLSGVAAAINHTQAGLRAALWSLNEEAEGPSKFSDLIRYASRRLAHWADVVKVDFVGREGVMSRRHAGALLMVLQEAVANALRHGRATCVHVTVAFRDKELELLIEDDGCGFDPDSPKANSAAALGIKGMKERVANLGGHFALESALGKGTKITIGMPL